MYELRVLTGLHHGAALPLVGQEWLIGTDEDADLILFDPGIKPKHCLLRLCDNHWVLTGKEGKVSDQEGHQSDQIDGMQPQSVFAVQGIWMTIVDAATPWPEESQEAATLTEETLSAEKKSPEKSSVLPFILGFISAATIAVTSTWAALAPEPKPVSLTESTSIPRLATPEDVSRKLHKMLTERELKNITIAKQPHQVILNGALKKEEKARLERMLTRFHQRFSTSVTIDNQVYLTSTQLPFEITQITSGSMASVVTGQGKRLFIGDELNGIRLVSVDRNKIIFKGKRSYEVTW
jgi:type III secretion protein D